MIVDGADNFPTRYLLNDASVWHGIPVVHGSIFRFEGQTTVFKPNEGPCYRCLFPQPPPPELAPSCAEGGVLGVLPGIVGSLQANEALKLALGIGEPLVGRLLLFDALETQFTEISLRRDPECPVCGDHPTITDYIDYVEFCQGAPHTGGPRDQGPDPTDAARRGRRRPRGRGDRLDHARGARRPGRALPRPRPAGARGRRRHRAVRQRLPRQRGRPHARGPRHAGARGLDRDPAPGHGRRGADARAFPARAGRVDAARRAAAARAARRRHGSTRSSRARIRRARSRTGSRRR